jgi:uncharacterized protein (TIGR02001 family)
MNLKKLAVAVGALALSGSALAELSANIAATSNYVWRGATQTDDGAAIQGGIDYAHDSGFYLGTWASNVDFGSGSGGEVEWDIYGGYAGEFNDFGYDLGVFYYAYPDSNDANFTELALSVSYKFLSAGINYTVQSQVNDVRGEANPFIDGDLYYHVGASFEVMPTWTIGGTIGYYDFEDDGVGDTDLSYAHYQLDVGKGAGDFGDFTFSVSKAGKEANGGDDDIKVFVSWAKTF